MDKFLSDVVVDRRCLDLALRTDDWQFLSYPRRNSELFASRFGLIGKRLRNLLGLHSADPLFAVKVNASLTHRVCNEELNSSHSDAAFGCHS